MGDLMKAVRKAAEETQNIDAAFQERVRRNYDMLSEAVRLMGVVAGAAGGGGAGPRLAPASLSGDPCAPLRPPIARRRRNPSLPRPPAPALDPPLRPRLKLTPTATDEEFKTVFEAAGGREEPTRSTRAGRGRSCCRRWTTARSSPTPWPSG